MLNGTAGHPSALLPQFEEIRRSLAQRSSDGETQKGFESLIDLLMRDNFSDQINWNYRQFLSTCPELRERRDEITVLNALKAVMRDSNNAQYAHLVAHSKAIPFLFEAVRLTYDRFTGTYPLFSFSC